MSPDPITIILTPVAKIVIESVWSCGSKLFGWLGGSLSEGTNKLIYQAGQKYVENYTERHGILKILGMREPVSLESIYTSVQFLDDEASRKFESIDSLEEDYRNNLIRSYQSKDSKKQEGRKVANENQYLMVLGGPGIGKSTFLRRTGLEALKGKKGAYKHNCIPVFIELKRFNSSAISIEKLIAHEFRICNLPNAEKSTMKLLEQGKLLILLDCLDEVPNKYLNDAISEIQNFVSKDDKNRFIASCRTAAYRSFQRFTDVAMTEFDDIQIEQFIKNWFQSEADKKAGTANKCWEILQKPENQAAKELAQTPLLLTFLCLVYDRSLNFPNNRSDLYGKAVRILLEEWASEKRISRDKIYQGLHTELEEILLSEIAYKGFESDRLFFSEREIVDQIKAFLASNLNALQHLDGKAVLNAIAVQQGILVERAEDIFSFSHLTLQEYLTAHYIDDQRQIGELVSKHLIEQRWKEVFLLVAGLMRGGADELLLLMEKEARKLINTPKLTALLEWADRETADSEADIKPVGKRAIANAKVYANAIAYANAYAIAKVYAKAIAYANAKVYAKANTYAIAIAIANAYTIAIANAYTIAKANAYTIANTNAIANAKANAIAIAIQESRELEKLNVKIFKSLNFSVLIARLEALKAKTPDDNQPLQVHEEFANRLLETLLKAFNLTSEMIDLSEEELKDWDNYLYANYLILQCKQAAVRVSPKTWEEIEDRMLRVIGD